VVAGAVEEGPAAFGVCAELQPLPGALELSVAHPEQQAEQPGAKLAPIPSEPVSPMKIEAGNELNHKKPTEAPTRQADSSASPFWPLMIVIAV